ncbi:MAG: hypothetical protein DMG21_08035 [Acidobacteria bacterium]|nr:MAG: hypothetical protein DMG21_08035 [Acidobacteriota bacterium]
MIGAALSSSRKRMPDPSCGKNSGVAHFDRPSLPKHGRPRRSTGSSNSARASCSGIFDASAIGNAFSRHIEHQADQYGLEVTHGLTPDSSQVAALAFNLLGDVNLGDPEPNPVDVFLFYDHPPVPDRVQFALTYDPWSRGQSGQFVK